VGIKIRYLYEIIAAITQYIIPERLMAPMTKILHGSSQYFEYNYWSYIFLQYKNVCQLTRTEQKTKCKAKVYRSLWNCRFSARFLFHVSVLAPRIGWWILDFWKIMGQILVWHLLLPPVSVLFMSVIHLPLLRLFGLVNLLVAQLGYLCLTAGMC